MKLIFKAIAKLIVVIFSKFYTLKIHQILSGYQDELYSIWIKQFLHEKTDCFIRKGVKIEGINYVKIGDGTQIGRGTLIEALEHRKGQNSSPSIILGKNCGIGESNHITAIGLVVIGDGVLTGRKVLISDNNHGILELEQLVERPADRPLTTKGSIKIGKNVWIGDNVCVLGGLEIGDGAIIASNAVVCKSVPAYSLVAGVPGKVVKQIR